MTESPAVIVVGAGLSGLSCAVALQRAGVRCHVIEASDGIGGRVRTDMVDGFRLDRGFQVMLAAYPECRRQFDYPALDLRAFEPGALVRVAGRFHRIADPWRRPLHALGGLANPVGSLADKLRVGAMRHSVRRGSLAELMARPETTALESLRARGFSRAMIDRFFRPFFGGILLDRSLGASSRMLEFVFRMMSAGDTVVPARGMGEIPAALAAKLEPGTIAHGTPVAEVSRGRVLLANGRVLNADAVVLAVDGPAAARLTKGRIPDPGSRRVICSYFAAPKSPVGGPWLVLNGDDEGPINNLAVMSEVAPEYAPAGEALVSVTCLADSGAPPALDDIGAQLVRWYGPAARRWRHLRTYDIAHAQPEQRPGFLSRARTEIEPGLCLAGDFTDTASLNGALLSGRRAARAVLKGLAATASAA